MSSEPPRPQTASDFRQSLPSGDFMMKNKKKNGVSKSVDLDGALRGDVGSSSEESVTRYVNRPTSITEWVNRSFGFEKSPKFKIQSIMNFSFDVLYQRSG